MPVRPPNPDNIRSTLLNAAHIDHEHEHDDLTGVTSDQHHAEAHTVASHSDTTATGAELETLTDGSDADALHTHDGLADGSHTHVESDVTDLDHDDADAIHDNVSGEIAAITAKTTPVDADVALIEDSAATNAKKKLSWANIKATLKTYFDTLYAAAAEGVTNGDAHDHVGGDGAQIDHGGLAGLADDDHTQYLNDARHETAHQICKVTKASEQTLSHNTVTTVLWDSEITDPDGWHSLVTNTGRITVAEAGTYQAAAVLTYDTNTTGVRQIRITVNGGGLSAPIFQQDAQTGLHAMQTTNVAVLSAGDYFEVQAFQNSGGNLVLHDEIFRAMFVVTRIV